MSKRKPVTINATPLKVTLHEPQRNMAFVIANILQTIAFALMWLAGLIVLYGMFGGAK